jgi:hypothetical protein
MLVFPERRHSNVHKDLVCRDTVKVAFEGLPKKASSVNAHQAKQSARNEERIKGELTEIVGLAATRYRASTKFTVLYTYFSSPLGHDSQHIYCRKISKNEERQENE